MALLHTKQVDKPPGVGSLESIDMNLKYVFNKLALVKINKNIAT